MLKSINAILTANTTTTLFTVENGYEAAIVTMEFATSNASAQIVVTKHDGAADVFTAKFSLSENDWLLIDNKIFLPSGYSLKITPDNSGVVASVSVDVSKVSTEE